MNAKLWWGIAVASAALLLAGAVQAQVPEHVYRATRYMPQAQSQDFSTLAEAEAYIRAEPSPAVGNAFLVNTRAFAVTDSAVLLEYAVPWRKYESYEGAYYDGHMSGNATDCYGLKCRTEEEMVAASMRAYPLEGAYTPTLRGAYLSPPFAMWSQDSSNAQKVWIAMNAVQYSGGPIPNAREIIATNAGGHSYTYRINRVDVYRCPALFTGTGNAYGEARYGTWPVFCTNNARGQILVRFKQRAPFCSGPTDQAGQVPNDRPGNPCAADFGNKEYREGDFAWDGFDFRRAYNSIADFPLSSGFGNNWSHTFSDRLMFDNAGNATYWIRPDGYVERLYVVESGKQVYYSPNTPNLALTKPARGAQDPADGVWRLSAPGQKVTWFDAKGRLLRKQIAGTKVDLAYCGGTELGTDDCPSPDLIRRATNSRGRTLEFAYTVLPGVTQEARLVSIKADGAVAMQYRYDAQGRMTAAWHDGIEGAGRRYLYGESAQLCRNASGGTIAGCDPIKFQNHMTGVEDESATRFATYSYDDKGRATISEHAGGAGRVTVDYLSATQSKATLASGAIKTFGYTNEDLKKISSATVSGGAGTSTQTTQVGYDNRWRVAYNSAVGGARTEFGYTGPNLSSRKEGLSEAGATTAVTRTTQFDWNTAYNEPSEQRVLNSSGAAVAKRKWTYNDRGQPLVSTEVDPATNEERSTTIAYCEQADVTAGDCPMIGLVRSVDGPRSDVADVTHYEYYPVDAAGCAAAPSANCAYRKGDLWMITDALGRSTEMLRYDSAGRLLSSKDINGVVSDNEFSTRGWLLATKVRGADNNSETDDRISRFDYWPTGQLKKSTLPDGASLTFTYDAAQRLTDVTDNDGNTIHYTLDDEGNRTKEDTKTSAGTLKRTLSRVYNTLGQLQANKDASQNATVYRYDGRGNQDRTTDALGRITDQTYDPLNRLVRTLQDVGGLNVETKFEYDPLDRVAKVTDPKGLDTVYAYNGFGDQTRLTSPDTGITNYTYNAAGEVATKQDANDPEPHRYTYDALGRPKTVSYTATGPVDVSYDYDTVNSICAAGETFAVGRVTAMRVDGTELKYCYDRFGQVVRKAQVTDGSALILRYSYSLGGHLKTMIYPDGLLIDYVRDSQARIKEIGISPFGGSRSVLLNEVAYEPFGPVAGWAYGNGRVLTRAYDQDYRIKRIFDSLPGGLSVYYEYNSVGELIGLKDGLQSAQLARYDYDSLGRLTVTRDGPTGAPLDTYQYDPSGDRVGLTRGGVTQIYGYSPTSHWLTDVAGSARGYDAAGNVVSMSSSGKDFVYDANGRLSAIKTAGVVETSYRYNSLGERVLTAPTAAGTDGRRYLYDNAHWIGSYGVGGGASQQTIWLGDFPVGVLTSNGNVQKLSYIQPDHLGAPRAVIDAARDAKIWSWDMKGEVFGATIPDQDPDADGVPTVFDLRYAGQIYDVSSGSHYNYYRDYDPHTGRYLQSDPLGLFGGPNTYLYVGGSPLSYVDPLGLFGFGVLGGGSVEAGVPGLSAGATASAGGGVFIRNWNDAPLGGFAGGGVLSKGPTAQTQWTRPGGTSLVNASGVVGAFAGLGGGAYITNADCPEDLGGVAKTSTFNLGIGPYKFSIQLGLGYVGFKPVWIGSMTVGPGLGLSLSEYPTNTVTTSEIR